jgi:SpoVK/Ycf46/Vps4 family AAA+-type ATPase
MAVPRYLKSLGSTTTKRRVDKAIRDYRPLLGPWLIDLALMLEWDHPVSSRRWPDIFNDSDFCAICDMPSFVEDVFDDDDDEESPQPRLRPTPATCRELLKRQRVKLQKQKLSGKLPLVTNITLLAQLLGLSDADQAILAFGAALEQFPTFNNAISPHAEKTSNRMLCQILARLTGMPIGEFTAAVAMEGLLATTGLVRVNPAVTDLEDKLNLMPGLTEVLLVPHKSGDTLIGRFLRRAAPATLTLANFPHLALDTATLCDYVRNALTVRTVGANVLLHGKPGVGKTEYVQALAAELGVDLYEITFCNEVGDPIKGEARLRAYSLCQRLLAHQGNALLMFDEVEDVFPSELGFLSLLFGGEQESGTGVAGGKAWINRTMERNPVPAVWISNQVRQIDDAYKRRFDYSVKFPIPPKSVRLTIAEYHLGVFEPTRAYLERIAANDEVTPGQLERAAKVARLASMGDQIRALQLVEQALDRSSALLDQKRMPGRNVVYTGYDLSCLNTDVDVVRIITGLQRRPRGTFCFYGAAGTGKSELARYLADEIGLPLILRRASDLLSKWVGESEQNIAAMFAEARQQQAVLVLDEADSFLGDRREARQSWEVTQVNELLTQMEAFEGIFICTTNLMEKLDQASLRRFAFKVRFDPLTPDQRWAMFQRELSRLGGGEAPVAEWEERVRGLERLTPGDFAVAARQFDLWESTATPDQLYTLLRKECEAKGVVPRKMGFGALV